MTLNNELVDLSGKIALVTSMGTAWGFEIAKNLVMANATVHAVNPDPIACRAQVKQLQKLGRVRGHVVNLQNPLAPAHLAHLLCEELPQLHVVVSNERISRSETSTSMLTAEPFADHWLEGDLCLIHDLLECLSDASAVADPARVVVIGHMPGLAIIDLAIRKSTARQKAKPLSPAQSIAQRFVRNQVNLNFIDLGPEGDPDAGTMVAKLLPPLFGFLSASAVLTRGEVAQIAFARGEGAAL